MDETISGTGNKKKRLFSTIFIFVLSIFFISNSSANDRQGIHPLLSDNFSASLGFFHAKIDSNIGVNGSRDIDLEDDLKFDDKTDIFLGGFKWRFTESLHVSLEYLEIDRDGQSVTINKDISWGNSSYTAGGQLKADTSVSVSRLFVGYSFVQSKQLEVGAGLGLHLMDFETELSGQATVNGTVVSNSVSNTETLAPLPNLGFYAAYAFTPKVIVRGRADWLSVDTGDFSGSINSIVADVQYQAFNNVGFGIGYHYLSADVDIDTSSWKGHADYTYYGPKLFMTVNF